MSSVAVSRPSDRPPAYAPISRAVAGATTIRSARRPRLVCGIGSPESHSEMRAGSEASAENVRAPTNRVASGVSTGRHERAGVDESTADLDRFVSGDAPRYPQDDATAGDRHDRAPAANGL